MKANDNIDAARVDLMRRCCMGPLNLRFLATLNRDQRYPTPIT
jgi:hypothetical protein